MANKKTVKRAAPAANSAPVAPACGCGCRGGHFLKKLIMLIIVFAAGFATCHFCCCHGNGKRMHMQKNMFVNGCLDFSKIKHPEMAQKMIAADIDGDGCVTKKEMKASWREHRADRNDQHFEQ